YHPVRLLVSGAFVHSAASLRLKPGGSVRGWISLRSISPSGVMRAVEVAGARETRSGHFAVPRRRVSGGLLLWELRAVAGFCDLVGRRLGGRCVRLVGRPVARGPLSRCG